MLRLIFIVFVVFTMNVQAGIKGNNLHERGIGKQRIALSVRYFDGEVLSILIPKSEWIRFLYKLTGVNTRDNYEYMKIMNVIQKNGIYDLSLLSHVTSNKPLNLSKLKVYLNSYLVLPVSYDMLGYRTFDDFKKSNFKCSKPASTDYIQCKLKLDVFINNQHAAYIMATNGFLINSSGFLDYSNINFYKRKHKSN